MTFNLKPNLNLRPMKNNTTLISILDKYSNQFYTVGSMAGKNVVSMKLSHFNPEISCSEKHAQCVADLLSGLISEFFLNIYLCFVLFCN